MKKPKIRIKVIKEYTGYSATTLVKENFIATEAETFEGLKANILQGVQQIGHELTEARFIF